MVTSIDESSDVDFPAAHSMDSTWFAVDAEGLVGVFETGEAGPAPERAVSPELSHDAVVDRLPARSILGDVTIDFEGVTRIYDPIRRPFIYCWDRVVVFVREQEALTPEMQAGIATPIRSTSHFAAVLSKISNEILERIESTGQMIGVYNCYHWVEHSEPPKDNSLSHRAGQFFRHLLSRPEEPKKSPEKSTAIDPAQCGVFVFSYYESEENAAPYLRVSIPSRPISIDDLPAEFRELAEIARFPNVRFADDAVIQPIEHCPCISWDKIETYLASDLKTQLPYPWKK